MKIDRRGFTLIELLAALVILGLLMVVAVPTINSIVKNKKDQLYVEDAKKLASVADYKMRNSTDASVNRPELNRCTLMDLSYLDNGDFYDPPYGGAYYATKSFVIVCNKNNIYEYYVQLMECRKINKPTCAPGGSSCTVTCNEDRGRRGVYLTNTTILNDPNVKISTYVGSNYVWEPLIYGSSLTSSNGIDYVNSKIYPTGSWDCMSDTHVLYDSNDKKE